MVFVPAMNDGLAAVSLHTACFAMHQLPLRRQIAHLSCCLYREATYAK